MRIGTIQVDLDGAWTISTRFGIQSSVEIDPIFESGLSNCLELLRRRGIRATFFVVGRDLRVSWKRKLIAKAFDEGHEIANHSMNHLGNLVSIDSAAKLREITKAEQGIRAITGAMPLGFKSPSYQIDNTILRYIIKRGYAYDSSRMPSYVLPLIRVVEITLARKRTPPYGSIADALKPCQPYVISLSGASTSQFGLYEIPTSVVPHLRLPFYGSFVSNLGKSYFDACFKIFCATSPFFNFLLHLKDLASASLPGVPLPHARSGSLQVFDRILGYIKTQYKLVPTIDLRRYLSQISG